MVFFVILTQQRQGLFVLVLIKCDSTSLHKSNSCIYYKPYRHIHFRTSVTRTWEMLKNSYISTATISNQNGLTTLCHYFTIWELSVRYYNNFFRFWKGKCCAKPVQHVNSLTDLLSSKVMQSASNSVTEAWHVISWHALLFSENQGLTVYVAVRHKLFTNQLYISAFFTPSHFYVWISNNMNDGCVRFTDNCIMVQFFQFY